MSKKTESLEIRVSPELKSQLAQLSLEADRTMSDVVRDLITHHVEGSGSLLSSKGSPDMFQKISSFALRASLVALPVLGVALVYSSSLQGPALASTEARTFFAELDRDQNGMVTVEEYSRFIGEEEDQFVPDPDCADTGEPCTLEELAAFEVAHVDTDADGQVAYQEFEAFILRQRAEEFIEIDIDGNGLVTLDELAWTEAVFMSEDDVSVSQECNDKLEAKDANGASLVCGDVHELRVTMAELDTDRDGHVGLIEFLTH